LQGSPALIRALFDPETRSMLRPLLQGEIPVGGSGGRISGVRASIADGELRVEIRERAFESVLPRLPAALRTLIEIGNRLVRPDDLVATIAANTRREGVPAVRLANLQMLSREYPAHDAAREALRAALGDESLEVRLHAARALGPEGRDTLLEIAGRGDAPDALVARAITTLGGDFPVPRAIETLQLSLDSGRTDVARACVERLARPDTGSSEVEMISRVLANSDKDLAMAAARALGAHVNKAAERALVAALTHDSADVRVAAADSLGRGGTPLAVVPLREAASAHPFDGALRRAARHAIALIQERVSGASPAQLSLAADAGGQLSLADEDQRGRVSLVPPDGSGTGR
jgi:HEAT repeat protein